MKTMAWLLPLVMGVSLGSVYFLPVAGKTAESAVIMKLPDSFEDWTFRTIPPSMEELGTLERDTEFAKAICLRPREGEFNLDGYAIPDRLDLSVVLSGNDLNNSIHRPERCMPAQGHSIIASSAIRMKSPNGREFDVKRLRSKQTIKPAKDGDPVVEFNCITYYFFVGHDRITNDHLQRTLIDMKDRLVRGMDQRWAYVSASMWFGKIPWIEEEVSEAEADEKIRAFVTEFAGNQIDWSQVGD